MLSNLYHCNFNHMQALLQSTTMASFLFLSPSVLAVLVSLILLSSPTSTHPLLDQPDAAQTGFQTPLRHVDSGKNLTTFELLRRAIKRGRDRIAKLHATSLAASETGFESHVHSGTINAEYFVNLSIGIPPLPFSAVIDTGSDLAWTQCEPCRQCFHQTTPVFNPSMSFSFSSLPCSSVLCSALPISSCNTNGSCDYTYIYTDYATTKGTMAVETFTFGNSTVQSIVFGCGSYNQGVGFDEGSGLLGLGRGPLSLVSQLKEPIFSYCLTPLGSSKTSMLKMGSFAQMKNTSAHTDAYKTTSLITNPSHPSYYYLSLQGITVGEKRLPIRDSSLAIREDGEGGMFIDSGTTLTYLQMDAYDLMKVEFISQVNLSMSQSWGTEFDLCFDVPSNGRDGVRVPRLVFHFDGMDLDLPEKNYMVTDGSGVLCVAIEGTNGISVLGNFQQQDMVVVYDLARETIAFIPTECGQI